MRLITLKRWLYYKPEIKISEVWETNEIISLVQFTIEFKNKLSLTVCYIDGNNITAHKCILEHIRFFLIPLILLTIPLLFYEEWTCVKASEILPYLFFHSAVTIFKWLAMFFSS